MSHLNPISNITGQPNYLYRLISHMLRILMLPLLHILLQVISLCPDPELLEKLQNCNSLLELVQKGLSEYLETKRAAFPR